MDNTIGEKIGKLTVEEYIGSDKIKGRLYMCLCDCGMDRVLSKSELGRYKSCGCNLPRNGSKKHPEYTIWRKMKERCYNKKQDNYSHYGGKGIKVCEEWKSSFGKFLYDMGERPTEKHQIDRIDSNGDYTPKNCRWATKSENMINRTSKNGKLKNIEKRDDNKYRVSISRDGNKYFSKQVETLEEAITLRDRMLEEYNKTGIITIKNL